MKVVFYEDGWDDFLFWTIHDKGKLKKLIRLIEDIKRHPFEGIGKPEPLKENYSGFWSRRIDDEHRLVYYVENKTIIIAQCRFHYSK